MRLSTLLFTGLAFLASCADGGELVRPTNQLAPDAMRNNLTACLDETTGINGDMACLVLTTTGVTDQLQGAVYGSSAGQKRILGIRGRARNISAINSGGCGAPNNEDTSCPPHQFIGEPLTWPNGSPWHTYNKLGSGVYERCIQKNCSKCKSTKATDCQPIAKTDIPKNVLEMLDEWGLDSAY